MHNQKRVFIITLFCLLFIKFNAFSQLTLTYPIGGEVLQGGNAINITWTSLNTTSVTISYSLDGGVNWVDWVYYYDSSIGHYSTYLPNINCQNAKIRILDESNNLNQAITSVFTVLGVGKNILSDTLWDGNLYINEDVWISNGAILTINAGSSISFAENKSMKALAGGKIVINGLVNNKVFLKSGGDFFWGEVSAIGLNSGIELKHAEIIGGQVKVGEKASALIEDSYFHDFYELNMLPNRSSILYTEDADTITVRRCHFNNYFQVNIHNTPSLVEECLFENWVDDGIDFDNSPSQTHIRNCTLRNGVGFDKDAIDFGEYDFLPPGSQGTVENCLIYNVTDKGISVGEDAINVVAKNNLIYNCGYGIAVKDDSYGYFYNNTISKCNVGIGLYEKNEGMGGSHVNGYDNISYGNDKDVDISDLSTFNLSYSNIGDSLFQGVGNISTNPNFIDFANNNFQLNSGSPCIGSGYNGMNMGTQFPVGSNAISNQFLAIYKPMANETLLADSVYKIEWNFNSVADVKIEYSIDNGINWYIISSSTPASQRSFVWTVPNYWSSRCKIKITDNSDIFNSISSFGNFIISPSGDTTLAPSFSLTSGYYNHSFYLTMFAENGTNIYYTIDGSEPNDRSAIYSAPILIDDRTNQPNKISMISTSYGWPGWSPPIGNVFKGNIIKACAYKVGKKNSKVITNTYIIDTSQNKRYHLPIISISSDSSVFFDFYKGIYVPGLSYNPSAIMPQWTGNFYNDIEVPVNFEFIDSDGSRKINQTVGIKIRGFWRSYSAKAIGVFARSEYGASYLNHQFFDDKSINRFKRIILRAGGGETTESYFVDDAGASLLKNLSLEIMYSQPSILFINGEYWGIHQIRDKLDNNYFKTKFNLTDLQRDNFDILENGGNMVEEGSNTEYFSLLSFIENDVINNNLSLSNNGFEALKRKMDFSNYLDYFSSEIYFANYDWPGWNEKMYRYKCNYDSTAVYALDGRFRWMLIDIEGGFGGWNRTPDFNALTHATKFNIGDPYQGKAPISGVDLGWPWFKTSYFINALLSNENFKELFINRFSDLLNTTFKESRVDSIVQEIHSQYIPYMNEHITRWGYPKSYNYWNSKVQFIFDFANNRPPYARQHLMDYFNLTNGTANISVDVSNPLHGKVAVNSLTIDQNLDGVSNPAYPWTGIYFKDLPVRLIAKPNYGYKFVNWSNGDLNDTLFVSLIADSAIVANFEKDTTVTPENYIFINEFMAANTTYLADEFGEFEDWIELYNSFSDTIDVANFYITDDLSLPTKYKIPSGSSKTKIPPHGFILFWADEDLTQGVNHVNIKLSVNGEQIGLFAPNGTTLVDSIVFGQQTANISFGRKFDADSTWVTFNAPTPNASNGTQKVEDFYNAKTPFNVYPNPVKGDKIYFNKEVSGKLYNSFGQLACEFNHLTSLNIATLRNGIYLLKINSGETKKIIVNRN